MKNLSIDFTIKQMPISEAPTNALVLHEGKLAIVAPSSENAFGGNEELIYCNSACGQEVLSWDIVSPNTLVSVLVCPKVLEQ